MASIDAASASEKYVEEYQRLLGLDYTILRYGSLYGDRLNVQRPLQFGVQSCERPGAYL